MDRTERWLRWLHILDELEASASPTYDAETMLIVRYLLDSGFLAEELPSE